MCIVRKCNKSLGLSSLVQNLFPLRNYFVHLLRCLRRTELRMHGLHKTQTGVCKVGLAVILFVIYVIYKMWKMNIILYLFVQHILIFEAFVIRKDFNMIN